ncbi:MAG: DUF1800 domain-containing protein [Arachidicoccus sp.]|nr:DUF1800 domain-containing protein [Arachidicoccus sp.]
MAKSTLKNKLHLLSRATFGINPQDFSDIGTFSLNELQQQINTKSSKVPAKFTVVYNDEYIHSGLKNKKQLTPFERMEINRNQVRKLQDLTIQWMNQMVNGEDQLREKTALFWHGHFACRVQNAYQQQELLEIIRKNALGNFGDLLREVSKTPAMLSFLNNQQNRKEHPNENFAREVMELFTLGRGNYTEDDVKQGARAFTGWMYDKTGNFSFNEKVHDTGSKKFLGKTGNFNGDDILNILLEKKVCAQFITRKLYRYFVNDAPDETHVNQLAEKFYQSNYNINDLLMNIFDADWFYDEKNIGNIIKSPVQLTASIQRALPMYIENPKILLVFNNALGQQPFYPPNVAGWPGGTSWIDSSSLMLRLKIPQLIQDDEFFHISTKTDDDIQMGAGKITDAKEAVKIKKGNYRGSYNVNAVINWNKYFSLYEKTGQEDLYQKISQLILASERQSVAENALKAKENISNKEEYIKSVTIALMSTPEFQLC